MDKIKTLRILLFLLLTTSFLSLLPIPKVQAQSVSYNPANNLITWSGTVNASYLYDMDKAGTLTLVTKTGITGTGGTPLPFQYDLRPADEKIMGGTKNDVWILIENFIGMDNATLHLDGKDEGGNGQNEIFFVDNNGTYYSTETWTAMSAFDVAGFNGTGSFDLKVEQGQWGEIWKTGDTQFRFDCRVQGTNWVTSWWIDTDVQIFFSDISVTGTYQYHIYLRGYNYLRFGQLDNDTEKRTSKGVSFVSNSSYAGTRAIYGVSSTSEIHLYSTSISFIEIDTPIRLLQNYGSGKIYNCELSNCYITGGQWTIYNLIIHGDNYGFNNIGISTIEGLTIYDTLYRAFQIEGSTSVSVTNLKTRNNVMLGLMRATTVDSYLIDADIDDWNIQWYLNPNGSLYRQYTFDTTITYQNGTAINGTETGTRTVIQHYGQGGGTDYNQTLGEDGTISSQTLSKGFYNRTGGNTLYSFEPYNLRIYNTTGYDIYSKNFTLNEKTEWEIALNEESVTTSRFGAGFSLAILLGLFVGLPISIMGIVMIKK